MIIIIGLVALIAAVIIGVAAVVGNTGPAQQLTSDFSVFDYHFHGSTGALFGYGVVLGAIGMFGLALVLSGAWRVTRRGMVARRELAQSRREMAAVRRDLAADTSAPAARAPQEPAWRRWLRAPGSGTARTDRGATVPTSKPVTAK
ncbi:MULTISPECIES: hypothetical protein [Nocardia]|uniref:LapA family protein n=1 Tax=Nocardia sputorum TaxID=2984338 RepID=A0ABM8D3X9_9NOCA|nr:hypothetical protein [Nocardia sputorum]BDT94664.1 hypothetical protein IFM12275_46400 [Nocardia sputorum]BDU02087.1 hypothetical protein IFM12276_51150 [Nocardia sputorum]